MSAPACPSSIIWRTQHESIHARGGSRPALAQTLNCGLTLQFVYMYGFGKLGLAPSKWPATRKLSHFAVTSADRELAGNGVGEVHLVVVT